MQNSWANSLKKNSVWCPSPVLLLGWYMAVEASDGEHNSYAVLQSPAMQQASANCTFQFYYHMYGEGKAAPKYLLL